MQRERPTEKEPAKSQDSAIAVDAAEESDDGGEGGREVRAVLLDWYAKHYSANRMTLAVYGKGLHLTPKHRLYA